MDLTFDNALNNEFFTILDLFKTDDKKVHELAYTLLHNRLDVMAEQTLNHKYFEEFVRHLIQYLHKVDHVPGQVNSFIFNIFSRFVTDNRVMIERLKYDKKTLEFNLEATRNVLTKSGEEKKQLAELLAKSEAEKKQLEELLETSGNTIAKLEVELESLQQETSQS